MLRQSRRCCQTSAMTLSNDDDCFSMVCPLAMYLCQICSDVRVHVGSEIDADAWTRSHDVPPIDRRFLDHVLTGRDYGIVA